VLGNIGGEPARAARFDLVWAEIDRHELPVLLHPTAPPGVERLTMTAYNRNLWYDAVVYERGALDLLADFAGPERVLYGSDFPHNVGDMAGCLARVDSLPGPAASAIRRANAERLFRL
jgi:Amidohydrolase